MGKLSSIIKSKLKGFRKSAKEVEKKIPVEDKEFTKKAKESSLEAKKKYKSERHAAKYDDLGEELKSKKAEFDEQHSRKPKNVKLHEKINDEFKESPKQIYERNKRNGKYDTEDDLLDMITID